MLWLSLLDNIQNLAKGLVSLLKYMLYVFYKAMTSVKGKLHKRLRAFSLISFLKVSMFAPLPNEAGNYLYKAVSFFYRKIDPSKSKVSLQERR